MTTVRRTAAGMLLIHGAWQGSWAWDAWLPELAARGWPAQAVDLPGNGANPARDAACLVVSLETYVEALQAALAEFDGPVVVVAHSGAGVAASQLAQASPDKIACLVYVAGMMLPSGMGYADLVEASAADVPGAAGIAPHLRWSDDRATTVVPPQAALDVFLHDCPPDAARRAAAKLTPQRESGRALVATLSDERFGRVPRIYVEALHDRSVLLPLQRRMQALVPGALVRSVDCGHVPQLARPAELADLVCDALAGLGIVSGTTPAGAGSAAGSTAPAGAAPVTPATSATPAIAAAGTADSAPFLLSPTTGTLS